MDSITERETVTARGVNCPTCHATPDEPCTTPRHRTAAKVHVARVRRAETLAMHAEQRARAARAATVPCPIHNVPAGTLCHADDDRSYCVSRLADAEATPADADPLAVGDVSAWPAHDLAPCVRDGEHHGTQRHPGAECPTTGTDDTEPADALREAQDQAQRYRDDVERATAAAPYRDLIATAPEWAKNRSINPAAYRYARALAAAISSPGVQPIVGTLGGNVVGVSVEYPGTLRDRFVVSVEAWTTDAGTIPHYFGALYDDEPDSMPLVEWEVVGTDHAILTALLTLAGPDALDAAQFHARTRGRAVDTLPEVARALDKVVDFDGFLAEQAVADLGAAATTSDHFRTA